MDTTNWPDPLAVKAESERLVLARGGRICEWLPCFGIEDLEPRSESAVLDRALVLNAMLQLSLRAPTAAIRDWLQKHDLLEALSRGERAIVARHESALDEQTRTNLSWYVDGLWALLWAGGLTEDLRFDEPVPETMASLLPNLQLGQGPAVLGDRFALRTGREIYRPLDLYYRLHWNTVDDRLHGRPTADRFLESRILERRRALQWILHADESWDAMDLAT